MFLIDQLRAAFSRQMDRRQILRGLIHKNDRHGMLFKAWGYLFTNHIRGDYVEFGVYRGASMVNSYESYKLFVQWLESELNSKEKWRNELAVQYSDFKPSFHGLDSFEGMPDNQEKNYTFAGGTFQTTLDLVTQKCAEVGLKSPELNLMKGYFENSRDAFKKSLKDKKIGILNIDCDLYSSTVTALQMSEPFIQVGTVILFDDYNCFNADNNQGERKAFVEFQKTSEFVFEPWQSYHFVGQAFLCVGRK